MSSMKKCAVGIDLGGTKIALACRREGRLLEPDPLRYDTEASWRLRYGNRSDCQWGPAAQGPESIRSGVPISGSESGSPDR